MSRTKDPTFRNAVTTEYDRQMKTGGATYLTVREVTGGSYQYVGDIIKKHRELTEQRGQIRECLCCDERFMSTGKHQPCRMASCCRRCHRCGGGCNAPL